MKKFLSITIAAIIGGSAFANTNPLDFEKYARKQDSLFIELYKKRDTATYTKNLREYEQQFRGLTKQDQNYFVSKVITAHYNLACTYSVMGDKAKALASLDKAIKMGYFDYANLSKDSDLDNLRNEENFKLLVQYARQYGDYMYILKNAAAYNNSEKRELPAFTYQSSDDANLVALRNGFNLDSIAGKGNEVSKMINLMHWLHNLIPHDGNHSLPQVRNAMSMISVCKKDNRGLNCRGLSTVLNECYLAMGFKSRLVTCIPKDSFGIDPDCHVINAVYSNSLKKWLWMDATNDAYVMNEKGELLSIEEVRDRLVNDKPVIVNPDANWNRKESVSKEEYLYKYMAKNLYLFQCATNSEYDLETPADSKKVVFVQLLPTEYFKQEPLVADETGGKLKYTLYKTNNASGFWKAPM